MMKKAQGKNEIRVQREMVTLTNEKSTIGGKQQQQHASPPPSLKILCVGETMSGKRSVAERMVRSVLSRSAATKSTSSAATTSTTMHHHHRGIGAASSSSATSAPATAVPGSTSSSWLELSTFPHPQHGVGIDELVIEFKDWNKKNHTVEVVCCDTPSLLSVALGKNSRRAAGTGGGNTARSTTTTTTTTISSTSTHKADDHDGVLSSLVGLMGGVSAVVVVFVVDMSTPGSATKTLNTWTTAINKYVGELLYGGGGATSTSSSGGGGEHNRTSALRQLRHAFWEGQQNGLEELRSLALRQQSETFEQAPAPPPSSSASAAVGGHSTDCCLLPSMIVANKMDEFEVVSKAAAMSGLKIPPLRYGVETLRRVAIEKSASFAATCAKSNTPSSNTQFEAMFDYLLQLMGVHIQPLLPQKQQQSPHGDDNQQQHSTKMVPDADTEAASEDASSSSHLRLAPTVEAGVCANPTGREVFLPHGVDTLGLLDTFVLADMFPMEAVFRGEGGGMDARRERGKDRGQDEATEELRGGGAEDDATTTTTTMMSHHDFIKDMKIGGGPHEDDDLLWDELN